MPSIIIEPFEASKVAQLAPVLHHLPGRCRQGSQSSEVELVLAYSQFLIPRVRVASADRAPPSTMGTHWAMERQLSTGVTDAGFGGKQACSVFGFTVLYQQNNHL